MLSGDIHLVATIVSTNIKSDYYNKYYLKSSNGDKFIGYFKKNVDNIFKIGDEVNITGEFSLPDVARNQGGFNYRYTLNANSVYGIIKVQGYTKISKKMSNIIYRAQNIINENLQKLFEQNEAGILNGILIGETNSISLKVTEDFKNSGITHLLAVSGSNVVMIIAISKVLFTKLFGKKHYHLFVIIFIVLFILLSGSSPSVMRAGIMAILEIVANLLIKKSNSINNLFLSALIILLINPISLLNIGFILSFLGTLGILFFSGNIEKCLKRFLKSKIILENLSITLSAQIMLLPIMAYYFNTISVISLLTNMLVLPVASIMTVAGLVVFIISIVSFPFAKVVAVPISYLIKYIMVVANYCAKASFFNFTVPTPKLTHIIGYFLIASMLIIKEYNGNNMALKYFFKCKTKRIAIILVMIFVIISDLVGYIPKDFIEIACIDVGQGDSFFIKTVSGKNILIDGGGSETSNYDVGKNILLPYLLYRRCTTIDYIFLSHAHADHMDGILTVIQNLKVGKVIVGPQNNEDEKFGQLVKECKKRKIPISYVSAGSMLTIDKIKFLVLYPTKNYQDSNVNNLSLVLKMDYANKSMLFTGDIEAKGEESVKKLTDVDILKVAHHGAKTSSTENFLKKTKPKIAVISVAEKNIYGHPNSQVVERLKKYADIYMTKKSGEIRIRIYKNSKIYIDERIKK